MYQNGENNYLSLPWFSFAYSKSSWVSLEQAQSPWLPHYGAVDVHFTGMADCFRQTVKNKGVLGLWSGLTPSLLKVRFCFHPHQRLS